MGSNPAVLSIETGDSPPQAAADTAQNAPLTVHPETALPDPQHRSQGISFPNKFLAFFGIGQYASHSRKSLVSMLWNVSWGFAQFVGVIIMLFLASLEFKSPRNPTVSEWDACDRPLGAWAALWLVRVVLASALAFWEYRRDLRIHSPVRPDMESGNSPPLADGNHDQTPQNQTSVNSEVQAEQPGPTAVDPLSLPYTPLYSRLTIFSSLVTLVWFVTGNILVYTSIDTCRYTAPRLWWLNFAILCILYLMVLEVVVLGFVVLIVAPILFIFWNIFLICIGRHPMQNPGMIRPEIGKLPKTIVDRIPLVVYIPPPDGPTKEMPSFPHIYPPKPTKRRLRFKLLQSFTFLSSSKAETSDKPTEDESENKTDSWADNWEQGHYPFITLEGNRAACAICLSDFEAPPKRNVSEEGTSGKDQDSEKVSAPEVSTSDSAVAAQEPASSDASQAMPLKLEDAGSGPQPLRLLGCTHAFHQTCIDPWLTDVSGRCPVCQRPVEPTKPHKSRRL